MLIAADLEADLEVTAHPNPYESPGDAAPPAVQGLPWVVIARFFGGLVIASALGASLFWTVWPKDLPDYFAATAFLAYLVGSWAILLGMPPLVRIGGSGLICGLCHGFTVTLMVLFIPAPPGGVNLFRGTADVALAFVIFGIVAGAVSMALTTTQELVRHLGQRLLRGK